MFTKKQSLAVKGVAILMMLWHHLFYPGNYAEFTLNCWPIMESQAVHIALFSKICVSLFAFISGYGLFLSYRKVIGGGGAGRWLYGRLVRTLSSYWFVLILAWLVCTALDNRPYHAYGFEISALLGLWNMITEFLGLTFLVGGSPMNGTWWYMSAAVVFIILLPLLYAGFEKLGTFLTLALLFAVPRLFAGYPGYVHILSFLPAFCTGMIFARHDLFKAWDRLCNKGGTAAAVGRRALLFLLLALSYKLYHKLPLEQWWDVQWTVVPVMVIVFTYDVLSAIAPLREALVFLGKHATNIFLLHSFFCPYYFREFIYSPRYIWAILAALLAVSLAASLIVERLKTLVRYEALIQKVLSAYGE